MGIKLPKTKSSPLTRLQDYWILLYGREKIGKTSMAAEFEDNLILQAEPGAKALSVYGVQIGDWKDVKEVRKLLAKTKRFQFVTFDTADLIFKHCQSYILRKRGIEWPGDEEYGKGWAMVRDEFQLEMSRYGALGRGLLFISHSIEREVRKGGFVSHRTQPTLANQARAVLEPMVDIWVHYEYDDDQKRVLRIKGGKDVAAGHRLVGQFQKVRKGRVPMGNSPAEAYQNFMKAFNNEETPESDGPARKVSIRKKKKEAAS